MKPCTFAHIQCTAFKHMPTHTPTYMLIQMQKPFKLVYDMKAFTCLMSTKALSITPYTLNQR